MQYELVRVTCEDEILEVARLDAMLDGEMQKFLPSFFDVGTIQRDYAGLSNGSCGYALLACVDGKAVGMAKVICGNVAMLESLVVEDGYRGLGIGSALLQETKILARARGFRIMMLQVLAGNSGAKRLYEGADFAEFRTSMVCAL